MITAQPSELNPGGHPEPTQRARRIDTDSRCGTDTRTILFVPD